VMVLSADPAGAGFVASLARPGGNGTGLSSLSSETSGKRLELLREVIGPDGLVCQGDLSPARHAFHRDPRFPLRGGQGLGDGTRDLDAAEVGVSTRDRGEKDWGVGSAILTPLEWG